jgi:dipeptidyl-peptidase-3
MVSNVNQVLNPGEESKGELAFAIPENERSIYLQHVDAAVALKVSLHELLGHGTGKLLNESTIDTNNPPHHPLTGKPVKTWYKEGQHQSTVFGDLIMTLEECRAEAVAALFALDSRILATMGYTESSSITAEESRDSRPTLFRQKLIHSVLYNLYLSFGQLGIGGLTSYQPQDKVSHTPAPLLKSGNSLLTTH